MDKFEYSFQVDSEIVKRQRRENDNYVIEYDDNASNRNKCAIYFSSHDIYFPNQESSFRFSILEKNHYEWRNCRIPYAYKHIFLRDVNKQWYLSGINDKVDSPQKLLEFLKKETEGYDLVTVGSSAGGYAAVLYGSLLAADMVFAFNCQFEIVSLLKESTEKINPLVFRMRSEERLRQYYDITKFVHNTNINYFVSINSTWDNSQLKHIGREMTAVEIIRFSSSHHGMPFPRVALPCVLGMSINELKRLARQTHHPLFFSIKLVGLRKTLLGVYRQLKSFIVKKYNRTLKSNNRVG